MGVFESEHGLLCVCVVGVDGEVVFTQTIQKPTTKL